ncbi:MAG: ABC transporter permease [Alphaproteobacteria bacterium]|nr:ABC transporter permease [Alphaproteobacteria bacterium]
MRLLLFSSPAGRIFFISLYRFSLRIAGFILMLFVTSLGLLAITFLVSRMSPVDPVLVLVGDNVTGEVYRRAYYELGLDKSLLTQFSLYCLKILRGDFGISILTGHPVIDDLRRVFPATIELATLGILIGVLVGVPLGVLAALRENSPFDQGVRFFCLFGYSLPIFWLGPIALSVFYADLGWVSGPGRIDVVYYGTVPSVTGFILFDSALASRWDVFRDGLRHLILPGFFLGYFSFAYISRMTRFLILRELSRGYVLTARIRGFSDFRIIRYHVFRNALPFLVPVIALSYAHLLEGAVITETVFAWPGLGQYMSHALRNADMNAVLGGVIVVGLVFICLNLFSDFLKKLLNSHLH